MYRHNGNEYVIATDPDMPRLLSLLLASIEVLVADLNYPGTFNCLSMIATGPFTASQETDGTYILYGKATEDGTDASLRLVQKGSVVGVIETRKGDGEWRSHGMDNYRLLIPRR